ncbi:MAG TPA: ABC transporter ATP-binding protein [Chitinophagaceae bacterium]|jgi:ABC-type bacteriocin/lantibiotic exporter with double-glycine peptidase domain|nr:ABC transporter ATP-binding protein [Chitinophagaceae bacterium]
MMSPAVNPVARIWNLVRREKAEITAVYFYAVLAGIIQLSLPVGIQSIINFVLGGSMSASLVILIILVVTGVTVTGIIYINQMKLIEKIQQKIFVRYAFDFAEHLPKIDLQKADAFYLPELVNRFFEIPILQKGLSKLLIDIPTATIQILFGLLLLSLYHPAFILFGILLLLILAVILYYTGSKGLRSSLAESSYKYSVAAWLEELARVVKSFKLSRGTSLHLKKTDDRTMGYLHARTVHFSVLLFQYRLLVILKTIITAAMLLVGSFLLINQQLNIGQFIAAEIVILIVISAVEKLITTLDNVYDVLTSVEKIGILTDKPMEITGTQPVSSANRGLTLELVDVAFQFNKARNVFGKISFKAAAGEKICLSGQEGSGKSTLLKLLSGIYTDFSGSILIDGIPLRNYNLDSLRSVTGFFISRQDIFHGTLKENITMGDPLADIEEISALAAKIGLGSFISMQKYGYDTELDPVGNHLPGNVIRKILLLRALIRRPRLLLLEEPWEGFPAKLQRRMQDFLLQEIPNCTVLVISNDHDFAARCDKVIYLDSNETKVIVNTKTTGRE